MQEIITLADEQKERVNEFCKLAEQRQTIRVKKDMGLPKPWSDDKIWQSSYFCNVFKDTDKVSSFIIDNVIKKYEGNPRLYQAVILARYLNWIPTLEIILADERDILISGNWKWVHEICKKVKRDTGQIVGGAFVVNSMWTGGKCLTKVDYAAALIKVLENRHSEFYGYLKDYDNSTLAGVNDMLRKIPGVGSFVAHQYAIDLTYCKSYVFQDEYTWTSPGPGSLRGLRRILFGSPDATQGKYIKRDFLRYLRTIAVMWSEYIEGTRDDWEYELDKLRSSTVWTLSMERYYYSEIKAHDVQHWLCEYDKYKRGGSSKRRYDGKA